MVVHRHSDVTLTNPMLSIEVFQVRINKGEPRLIARASPDIVCCFDPSRTIICRLLKSAYFLIGDSLVWFSKQELSLTFALRFHSHGWRGRFLFVQPSWWRIDPGRADVRWFLRRARNGWTRTLQGGSSSVTSCVFNVLKKIDEVGTLVAEVNSVRYFVKPSWWVFLGSSICEACLDRFKCCTKGTLVFQLFELGYWDSFRL